MRETKWNEHADHWRNMAPMFMVAIIGVVAISGLFAVVAMPKYADQSGAARNILAEAKMNEAGQVYYTVQLYDGQRYIVRGQPIPVEEASIRQDISGDLKQSVCSKLYDRGCGEN